MSSAVTVCQVKLVGWLVSAIAAGLFAALSWSSLFHGVTPSASALASWAACVGLLSVGLGVVLLRPLARRLFVVTAWLASLYAAVVVLLIVMGEVSGRRFLLSPPVSAPLRTLWLGMVVSLIVHLLVLGGSLGLWWLFTRQRVKEIFLHAKRPAA